jgi:hypothetical protein
MVYLITYDLLSEIQSIRPCGCSARINADYNRLVATRLLASLATLVLQLCMDSLTIRFN